MLSISFFLLTLFIILRSEASYHYSAKEIRDLKCPQCKEIRNGDFSQFWVVYQQGKYDYLSRTNIAENMELGSRLYSQALYPLFQLPVFIKDDFEPFLVECNYEGQLKMSQVKDNNGEFKIHPKGSDLLRDRPEYCFEGTNYKIDRSKAFLFQDLYVVSPSKAYNVSTICTGTKTVDLIELGEKNNDITKLDKDNIAECFDETKDFACVADVDNPSNLYKLQNRTYPTYMREGLVVYSLCNGKRCAYFIYDTQTGIDWYIPDNIKMSNQKLSGMHTIDLLIPLIQPNDRFLTSTRRFQNSTTSTEQPMPTEIASQTTPLPTTTTAETKDLERSFGTPTTSVPTTTRRTTRVDTVKSTTERAKTTTSTPTSSTPKEGDGNRASATTVNVLFVCLMSRLLL